MKKSKSILILITLVFFYLLPHKVYCEEGLAISAQEASILFMEGEVTLNHQGAAGWIDAEVDMILSKGDNLKTGPESWAEIGFGKDFVNVVRVRENTLLELIDLGPVRLGLLKGEVRSLVESLDADTAFEIAAPTAICGARATGWDTNTDGKQVIVDAYEDEVYFYAVDKDGNPVMEDPIIEAVKIGMLIDIARPIIIEDIPLRRIDDWRDWKKYIKDKVRMRSVEVIKKEVSETAFTKEKARQEIEDEGVDKEEGYPESRDKITKLAGDIEKYDKIKQIEETIDKNAEIEKIAEKIEKHDKLEKIRRNIEKHDKIEKIQEKIERKDKLEKMQDKVEKHDRINKLQDQIDRIEKIEKIQEKTEKRQKIEQKKDKIEKRTKRVPGTIENREIDR